MYILYGLLIIILCIITQVGIHFYFNTYYEVNVYHIRHSDNMTMCEYAIVFENNQESVDLT